MFDIVLHQPEIPPNTGNIIRLAANTGCRLHLVKPLGFRLDDRSLRRSGLDYGDVAGTLQHSSWEDCLRALEGRRLFALSTKASTTHAAARFEPGDVFVFGSETRGLPAPVLRQFAADRQLRIPMRPGNRSLNLSNAVAVVVYEAWRQQGFGGA
jgi:tRNA (cytidine/uridine-2'-O-)-methyltransferase